MRPGTITLSTRDLPRSRSFYGSKLGFPVKRLPPESVEPRLVFRTGDLKSRCFELRDRGVSVEGPLTSTARDTTRSSRIRTDIQSCSSSSDRTDTACCSS